MTVKNIKVTQLIGVALDYAFVLAANLTSEYHLVEYSDFSTMVDNDNYSIRLKNHITLDFIHNEKINLNFNDGMVIARNNIGLEYADRSSIVAVAKAFIASKFGESVEVPYNLTSGE